MPPTNPWGKKPQQKPATSPSFPELKAIKSADVIPQSPGASQYEEIQADELIALESIYGEDFRRIVKNQGAWKKKEPCFEIRIKSSDDEMAVTLCVTLTASYPKTIPLLSLKGDEKLREGTRYKIQQVVENMPKELVSEEQPMIMEIVTACLDILEDAAQAKAAGRELPSLEEERAIHEAASAKLAEHQKAEEEKKRRLETLEEQRMQEALVQDELKRQRAKVRETKKKNRPSILGSEEPMDINLSGQAAYEGLAFEQPISVLDVKNNLVTFQVVSSKVRIRRGPVSKCFTVRPVVAQGSGDVPTLVLKETDLSTAVKDTNKFKSQLQILENELKSLKDISHQNIIELLAFKVHKTVDEDGDEVDSSWTVSILVEYAEKGSLHEFLDIAGSLGVEKIRAWTIELLDGLRFLHEKGIVHEDIHAGNVLLLREANGEVRPKLADAGYQRKLQSLSGQKQHTDTVSLAKSAYWLSPETATTSHPQYTQKTDIWDFGVVFLQMIFGLTVVEKYTSPNALADSLALSSSLNEFVLKLFKADPKKRPRAVELGPSEFLATDAPILDEDTSASVSRLGSISSLLPITPRRQRHDSMGTGGPFARSRYMEDFVEEGRLGKGGFGEVVKARKRLDGQIYAIKKITQKSSASLTEVLKEVRVLSQLSHPSVVRYYNTWTEEVFDGGDTHEGSTSGEAVITEDSVSGVSPGGGPHVEFGTSTGGLDFMSSSGYPQIVFGDDDDDDESDSEEDSDEENSTILSDNEPIARGGRGNQSPLKTMRTRSNSRYQRPFRTVLYISMEYCEKRTLRDLIKRGLYKDIDETWRLFRQVLEGLAHIHGLNVVHRDLKPENIFIDAASNVKIGDFGLATSGQYTVPDRSTMAAWHVSGDMTRSIGTAFYVAPELRSSAGGSYTGKVDMYSLGIIFFEMCYRPLIPGMDRASVGDDLRQNPPALPSDFKATDHPMQADIILSLLNHSPKERPSSSELLKSGKLPVQMESETIRQALAGLTDSASPYYDKTMKTLFSLPNKQARDFAWDMGTINPNATELLLQGLAKRQLTSIFRHHGAVETSRAPLFPISSHYPPNSVRLLDPHGTLLQLPYDLTLPNARALAKRDPPVQRSFSFGSVFRDRESGSQPQTFGEVDFDIMSTDTLDLALKEAEVLKVLDEIVGGFPSLATTQMCFHLNHSDLLSLIFDFCRIEPSTRLAVSDTLTNLNIHNFSWQKIKVELRSPLVGVSATSVDDLQRFDFRDTPSKAFQKLKTLFEGTDKFERASSAIAHLRDVIEYSRRFGIKRKIYITPLGSLKEKFCKGGIVFSCIYDKKARDVFAAGGRYDSLIREHKHKSGSHGDQRHAVGFNLAWEKLARLPKVTGKGSLKKTEEETNGLWSTKRCDVLVASHDAAILRSTGIEIVQALWQNDISAELARDSSSPEDLLSKYRDDLHSWIVIIKQDSIIKVKTMDRKDAQDVEIPSTQLLSWLSTEIRDRAQREGTHHRNRVQRNPTAAHSQDRGESSNEHEQEVRVLIAGTKSKKSNRRNIIEQAQGSAATLVNSMLEGPIAAIETTDAVLEMIKETRLSDPESWRKVVQSVGTGERRYIGEVWDLVKGLEEGWRGRTRDAFVYNFRTGKCVYYDLEA